MYHLLTLILFISFSFFSNAQGSKTKKLKLDKNPIVKDTAGNILPALYWQQMVLNPNFVVQPVNEDAATPHFLVRPITASEKYNRLEKLPPPPRTKAFLIGKPIESFSEKDLAGNLYTLKELKGKVVVINFWFINCPPCQMEIPELNGLVQAYKDNKDVIFLAIALDNPSQLERFLQAVPFYYNIIPNGRNLARQYNISGFPTHVVLNKEGLVTFHTDGLAENTVHWVQKSINKALSKPNMKEVAQNP